MLDKSLEQLKLVKFARRAPFYWRSFLDPDADEFDATRQELLDSHKKLMRNYDATTNSININGTSIPLGAINHLYYSAWKNNDTLAAARRSHGLPTILGSTGAGLVGGGFLGHELGRGIVGTLGGGDTAKGIGGIAGMLLLGALGAGLGNRISTRAKQESMPETLDNGTSVLSQLNSDLGNLYSVATGGKKKLTGDAAKLLDISKVDTAKERKLGDK